MTHTISGLVKNRTGILTQLVGAFRGSALNIKSVAVSETDLFETSRATIVVEGRGKEVKQATAEVRKLRDVLEIDNLSRQEFLDRELALIKVQFNPKELSQLTQTAKVFGAEVIAMGGRSITFQIAGEEKRVNGFVNALSAFGICCLAQRASGAEGGGRSVSRPAVKKLRSLKELLALAKRCAANKRLVLAAADSEEALKCVREAQQQRLVRPILVGDRKRVARLCRSPRIAISGVEIIDEPDPQQAAVKAVAMCREGEADILMKGNVHTGVILRAILDRESGLGRGGVLSNTAVFESPREKRLMFMADPAVNINPDVTRKVEMIRNAVWVANRLGFTRPRVAVLAPIEKVNAEDMPSTADAALIARMGAAGQVARADIAGPCPLDVAVNPQAAKYKNIKGPVAGRADILLCPDLNSANVLYKALIHLAFREVANAMIGVKTKTPLVMNSRADSSLTRLYTMALAAVLAGGEN